MTRQWIAMELIQDLVSGQWYTDATMSIKAVRSVWWSLAPSPQDADSLEAVLKVVYKSSMSCLRRQATRVVFYSCVRLASLTQPGIDTWETRTNLARLRRKHSLLSLRREVDSSDNRHRECFHRNNGLSCRISSFEVIILYTFCPERCSIWR